jgi:hypothetical protein
VSCLIKPFQILQVASLRHILRTVRKPIYPLLASLGVIRQHLLIADLLILESLFLLLALVPMTMLCPYIGMPTAVLILPIGAIGLVLLTRIGDIQ